MNGYIHEHYNRQPIPADWNPNSCPLVFQHFECDYYVVDKHHSSIPSMSDSGSQTIVRLFGVTDDGHSVLAHVHSYAPYLYIPSPGDNLTSEDLRQFEAELNQLVCQNQSDKRAVLAVEIVRKQSMFGYHANENDPFLRISFTQPKFMSASRSHLENGIKIGNYSARPYTVFEVNIDLEIRFLVDTGLVSCGWVELPSSRYSCRAQNHRQSRSQFEVDVQLADIIAHKPDQDPWMRLAPARILSFDIECAGRKGIFPEPNKDAVIQIANVCKQQGSDDIMFKNVFTLNTCAAIADTDVFSFRTEAELLRAWSKFFIAVDADVVTGYNIQNFDFTYLLARADHLNLKEFAYLGRIIDKPTSSKRSGFQSKQMGRRETHNICMDGRVVFDVYLAILREQKLRSYTLNSVSYKFLGEQKEDVHHSAISELQAGDEHTRRRLAVYCVKDAVLPLKLIDKLLLLINAIEMSRVTGVPINQLLQRGQQIKVISQLLRKCKQRNFIIPSFKADTLGGEEDYVGGAVLEPIKGYYNTPITTLDFSSLYPSIMIAHNLCYSTLLPLTGDFPSIAFAQTPTNHRFVGVGVRKGLLPEILADLLAARKRTKQAMKVESDEFRKKVLDGRQLALKISANSVYGFTGAQVGGKLPCLEISQSVTAYGREMIMQTKKLVEAKYTKSNGYPSDAIVIYGDTDSVMIRFGTQCLKTAMDLGREAAGFVSTTFPTPIKLEFEKCYLPYLLISKKRYAGVYYSNPEFYDKVDCKGIETVRRDNCPLVATLITVCLRKLLVDRDPDNALAHAKDTISDLLCNRIDISELVITKELTKTDKEYSAKQAHVELAHKMKKRDPGTAPQLGDRVAYVICAGAKGEPTYSRAEDPIYVLEHDVPIDTQYYLNNQLSKPLLRIFEPVLGAGRAESCLLKGEHTLSVRHSNSTSSVNGTGGGSGLMAFAKRVKSCLSCHRRLDEDCKDAMCTDCGSKKSEILQKEISQLNYLEQEYSRMWTECQRCQGSLHQEIICNNSDCPIFYRRTKFEKDLMAKRNVIDRFRCISKKTNKN